MRLHVTVQLRGEIVEDTVVPVVDGLRLGEHDLAAVAFPGMDLLLQRDGDVVLVRGRRLRDGDTLELGVEDVLVTLRPVTESLLPRTPLYRGDMVLPVLLVAMVLVTLTAQTAHEVLRAKADLSEDVVRRVEALLVPPRLEVPEAAPTQPVAVDPGLWDAPGARYVDHPE